MTDITNMFGGEFTPKQEFIDPPEQQLSDAMRQAGIEPPAKIEIDGQMHRFSTKGRKKDDSGWYIVFPDEPNAGRFGCWRDQIDCVFKAKIGRDITPAENMAIVRRQAEAKAERDRAREQKAEVAADTVTQIWQNAGAADPEHPYLKKKSIQPNGARVTGDGRLMVPLFDIEGNLSSLQYIGKDEKRYHPGGTTKGCTWIIGEASEGPVFIAEGFATAATIHEVSQRPCFIAYSANNLPETTRQVREEYGTSQEIIIVADNDESGVGRNKADEASAKYGGRIIMPPEQGDANDYHLNGGNLEELLFPPADDWLIQADEFSSQPAPINWLIKHWLQSDSLIMVHGPSGGGKTFMVLDMLLSIASKGKIPSWFDHKVRNGAVAYLAGEGHHGLKGRIAAWKQHHDVKELDMWLSKHGIDLNTPQGYQKAADAIRALPSPPAVIAIDTLHRHLQGDENSAVDTKTMLDACAALQKEFGCMVLLVHHTGVSVEAQHRARGSSAWRGALDIEISVIPGDTIQVVQRKAKDSEQAKDLWMELQSIPIKGWLDEDQEQVTSAVIIEGLEIVKNEKDPLQSKKKVLEDVWHSSGEEYLGNSPYVTREAIIRLLEGRELSPGTIKQYLKPTPDKGVIGPLIEAREIEPAAQGWIVIGEKMLLGFVK